MAADLSPTARALLALEVIQNNPGITAERLGDRLGVTERAARRYVAIETLPETFIPPHELDALRTLEEHLSQGWAHEVDVLIDATVGQTPRSGRRAVR